MSQKAAVKTLIEIYDPAMCCSTGVCGPDVDDTLADFANDVKWLKSQGFEVNRFNLGQEPEAFKMNPLVLSRLKQEGSDCLPLIFMDSALVSDGEYPNRERLTNLLKIDSDVSPDIKDSTNMNTNNQIMTDKVEELIALGAALASNCESSLEIHYKRSKELGISENEIAQALQIAQNIKQIPSGRMIELANTLLGVPKQSESCCTPGSGCC
jgi:AhpD family alkylhydroperoxidase